MKEKRGFSFVVQHYHRHECVQTRVILGFPCLQKDSCCWRFMGRGFFWICRMMQGFFHATISEGVCRVVHMKILKQCNLAT